MNRKHKLILSITLIMVVTLAAVFLLRNNTFAVLSPKGQIARRQHDLIVLGTLLSLIIVLPVFALTFGIVWKYRASNVKAKYRPDWDHNTFAETIWWVIPTLLITVLSIVTWRSTYELDPFKTIASDAKTMTIQVVALEWKWLFIYPAENIASVNYVQFPEDTPIRFEITADAPMNSFWIPQLGGQMYAMNGMSTNLNLMADAPGDFSGLSANISGKGFAGMKFTARSSSLKDFYSWVTTVKQVPDVLTLAEYNKLSVPTVNNATIFYSAKDKDLYDKIVMKFTGPENKEPDMEITSGHEDHH